MPLLAVDRFLIPNLRTYTAVSVVVLCISFYYAAQAANNPTIDIDVNAELSVDEKTDSKFSDLSTSSKSTRNDTFARQVKQAAKILVQDSFSVWSMINMAYCCILLFGAFIQKVVFGELRPSEQQHIKDKFWTFIFYKFILVFGIMNVQYVHEVIFWCAWFSILGFLNLLTQLGKDRFEYLSFATPSSNWSQIRLVGLLVGVFCLTGFMLLISAVVGVFAGFNTFAFMAAECIQLNLLTIQVILKYITYMYDIRGGTQNIVLNWEKRGPVAYYTELCFELCVLFLDFLHHIHMLLWSNMFLSIASLVVCMQLRHLFYEIRKRIKRHQHYLWVARHMEENYPLATVEELSTHGDHCAICWDEMAHARKLPCSHMFHNSCLQSWLEQDTSCPTCRTSLGGQRRNFGDSVSRLDHSLDPNIENLSLNGRLPHHFFHFDGSRYVPWLPSFSVEFTHFQLDSQPPIQTYEIDAMARQIQQLFPSVPVGLIAEDLRISRSIELTIENILEGRVVVPREENEGGNDEGRRPHEERVRVELEVPQASQETTSEEGESSRGGITGCQRPVLFSAETDSEGSESDFQNENSSGSSENKAFADDEPHSLKVIGGFSDSSAERERTFRLRKEQMLASARRKYLRRTQMRRNSILGHSTEG